ncbi:class I SAM-dependent methyltransferase [Bradyrhizobium erythrophlei]|uniref:Methyltransferase domain-containing protein n=1 Tax=Bradyrhizobium erythrophlei TaxID=1437360 RepID=A0A1M7UHI5_9BRAD|nr:class I SAM-dependent methyltransferase [Bradyrhizobium erythrophlei]SHN82404.1 Methyltransferase domain-containing protein [Bradyrhizobium erythrophlei]
MSIKDQCKSPAGDTSRYWESIFSSRGWGAYPPEDLIRFIARNYGQAADRATVRVLEIGCGPGPNIWYLVREGYGVAGIDGSVTAIAQARKRLSTDGLPTNEGRVDLRVGNFVNLPWSDAEFDAVIDIAALYANKRSDIVSAIDEVFRTLKPGGMFFGKMFGADTTGSDSGILFEPGTRQFPDRGPCAGNEIAHFFERNELLELFRAFRKVDIDHSICTERNGEILTFHWLVSATK